jgi:hypothetical protein
VPFLFFPLQNAKSKVFLVNSGRLSKYEAAFKFYRWKFDDISENFGKIPSFLIFLKKMEKDGKK